MQKFMDNKILKQISKRPGVWLVGGSVRDQLLKRPVSDWDLAVEKDPESLAQEIADLKGSRVVMIGKGCQHVYRIAGGKEIFDVALVQGKNIDEDLLRRDFTINAMAAELFSGRITDPRGGRKDLEAGIVRMVGEHVLDADPLRLLRAFRMAAVLGFKIEPQTLAAVSKKAANITMAAGERIRDEWLKILKTPDSAQCLAQMDSSGLLCAIFPELQALKGCRQNRYHDFDVFDHTMAVYAIVEKMLHQNDPALSESTQNSMMLTFDSGLVMLKHAALLHDIGKPLTKTIDEKKNTHFYNHPSTGAQMAADIHRLLKFSNSDARYVDFLIRNHLRPLFVYTAHKNGKMTQRALTRFFIKTRPHTPDLLILAAADMAGKNKSPEYGFLKFASYLLKIYYNQHLPAASEPPLLNGHDIIKHLNLAPCPVFARILDQVEESRLCGEISTKQQAIELAQKIIKSR